MPSRECFRLKRFIIRVIARRHVAIIFLCLFIIWFAMFCLFWDGPPLLQPGDNEPFAHSHGGDAQAFLSRLAHQQRKMVDGPFSGRMTGYDTKKLLAVLLDSLVSRISSAQREASRRLNLSCDDAGSGGPGCAADISGQGNVTRERKVDVADLIMGVQDRCALNPVDLVSYPRCEEKVKWMQKFWTSHSCYRNLGVDGSICSFLIYLSEVESFCPRLSSRVSIGRPTVSSAPLMPRSDLAPLLDKVLVPFDSYRKTLDFVRERIARLWPHWVSAAAEEHRRSDGRRRARGTLEASRRLRVHLHLGLLSRVSNWHFAEGSTKGGPLGELVQWSDLIAALFAQGHDLRVTTEVEQLASMASKNPLLKSPCLAPTHTDLPDLIFTDLIGLRQFALKFQDGYHRLKCLMRILDTFGTHPRFNLPSYARKQHCVSVWGGRAMHPAQFFNLYPLTPDNSFLGFVVERPKAAPVPSSLPVSRLRPRELALVYGKKAYMWKGMKPYLSVINDYFDVHATVADPRANLIPSYVTNHRFLEPKKYQQLLSKARVFVGLGFPFEGPAPVEAIAQGAVFLNPRFDPPLDRLRSSFFRDKPTDRQITSQHPYIEQFIGEPYSYLVDMKDFNNVREVLWKVLASPTPESGMVPFELTEEGMLQRVSYYLRTQDFCAYDRMPHYGAAERWNSWRRRRSRDVGPGPNLWPPPRAMQYLLGVPGETCERTCRRRSRICEPSYFPLLNSVSSLHELGGVTCDVVSYAQDHLAPFRDPHARSCVFQSEHLLFSCAGQRPGVQRVCPCRDFRRGQIALCLDCVL